MNEKHKSESSVESGRLSILAVDDDNFMTELIKTFGQKLGCDVHAINDSREISKAVLAYNPDVIFLDLVMPNMDGVETVSELARLNCKADIVLMSGLDNRKIQSVSSLVWKYQLNYLGSLSKPINFGEFNDLVSPLIEKFNQPTAETDDSKTEKSLQVYGPHLMFEPEVSIDGGGNDGQSLLAHLVWVLDDRNHVGLESIIKGEQESRIYRGTAILIMTKLSQKLRSLGDLSETPRLKISLSSTLLLDDTFPDFLAGLCKSISLENADTTLEFDEQAIISDPDKTLDVLNRLSLKSFSLGIRVREESEKILGIFNEIPMEELIIDMRYLGSESNGKSTSELEFELGSMVSFAARQGVRSIAHDMGNEQHLALAKNCSIGKGRGPFISPPLALRKAIDFAWQQDA